MPNRVSISIMDACIRLLTGELKARHLNPYCLPPVETLRFYTSYGFIPVVDVVDALNGDSDMFQLWMMGFSQSLSEN